MIRLKKLTALLVSAALALSLLAGCGGSKALSQVIADLLSGQYNNVTVEVDPALTAALKKAAAAGDTQEEVLAALVENLNLSGGSITFNNLGDGQQGQHGVTLTFQPGSDPDTAARSAFTEWNRVFSSLPDDGSYRAHVSMIEAEGGYYIAVDVEVLKAGSHDKDEPDEPNEPDGPGYTETVENGKTTYTVTTGQGLKEVAAEVNTLPDTGNIVIKLQNDITLPDSWTPIGEVDEGLSGGGFDGTLDGQDHTITMGSVPSIDLTEMIAYAGLFGAVGSQGQIKNLTIQGAKINISSPMGIAGALAAICFGTIKDCTVQNVDINVTTTARAFAGGLVGNIGNDGKIIDCSVKNSTIYATATAGDAYAGGLAAGIGSGAIIKGTCTVTGLTVEAESPSGIAYAGGILSTASTSGGLNPTNFTWNNCIIKASSDTNSAWAGGIVGRFYMTSLLDCHWDGQGSVTAAVGETKAIANSTNLTEKKDNASAGTLTGGDSDGKPLGIK